MASLTPPSPELRFKNVSLHRRGRPEHGTLYLTQHHLIFSYRPNDKPTENNSGRASHGHERTQSGNHAPTTTSDKSRPANSTGDTESLGPGATAVSGGKRQSTQQKPRSKEIYVPYPLVNHCTLRPSHAQSNNARQSFSENSFEAHDEDEDAFPPTFGTSSFVRPSTDSARLAPYSSPRHSTSPAGSVVDIPALSGKPPAIRLRCKDFQILALHFHASGSDKSADELAREAFFSLRGRCCVTKVDEIYAFHFKPPPEERATDGHEYDARREFARMGISPKAAEGPGAAWRISDINHDYSYSGTYPKVLCVPRVVSDNMLKYGGSFRSKSRIPALAYLHSNGGSITRSSQPMVGVQSKRNPQDERLVSAIFSSHTPPLASPADSPPQSASLASPPNTALESSGSDQDIDAGVSGLHLSKSETALDESNEEKTTTPRKRVYGSTRRNLIVDARPKLNMLANRATGGGIEDVANYMGAHDMPIEKVFLNIANIHVMRSSLEKVFESLGNSDYLDLPPNQEALRKSGWLSHIAGVLEGAEMVARVVGLGGSHVLVHCSDGWDRTSQVSALAQVMLDPHYRTLDGFITLVQKDFLAFGHKFRHRNGIEGSEKWFEIENERIQPSRAREDGTSEPTNLQAIGSKALSGARNWFEKNRGGLFKQNNSSHDNVSESPSSRPTSPPPNPMIHSKPTPKEEKQHKMDEKEVAPIFHQFLDAVYQLLYQLPNAFEFNERFLRRLFYQSYAGQYGEFLFNNERERSPYQDKLPSTWRYFLARRAEFSNPDYVAKTDDPLLFPRRQGAEKEIEMRWWNALFGRKDEEMNVPRALAAPEPPFLQAHHSSTSVGEGEVAAVAADAGYVGGLPGDVARTTKSTPNLSTMPERSEEPTPVPGIAAPTQDVSTTTARPPLMVQETDPNILATYAGASSTATDQTSEPSRPSTEQFQMVDQGEGDPLGVSSTAPAARQVQNGRMDFAAFAQQTAYRER